MIAAARIALVTLALLASLALGACGSSSGGSSTSGAAATTTATGASGGTSATGGATSKHPPATAAQALRECLARLGAKLPSAAKGQIGPNGLPKGMTKAQFEALFKKQARCAREIGQQIRLGKIHVGNIHIAPLHLSTPGVKVKVPKVHIPGTGGATTGPS